MRVREGISVSPGRNDGFSDPLPRLVLRWERSSFAVGSEDSTDRSERISPGELTNCLIDCLDLVQDGSGFDDTNLWSRVF
jgi:hypothetical protein